MSIDWKRMACHPSEKGSMVVYALRNQTNGVILLRKGWKMEEQALRIENFGDVLPGKICYWWNQEEGVWYIYFPMIGAGGLGLHQVIENADGTITVMPSILTKGGDLEGNPTSRHGYLTNGKWRDV